MGKMITLKADRMLLMFGGAYGETLNDELWLYNINTNLWQSTYIADKEHKKPGFFYNCLRCSECDYCKNETEFMMTQERADSDKRMYCEQCRNCTTDDKERENLSLYS